MRRDCSRWLAEVELATPSIVVVARNADGTRRSDVRVVVDGVVVAERLTGDPLALDPGDHVIVLDAGGGARIEQRLTLHEGDRERRIEITLPKAEREESKPSTPIAEPDRDRPPPERPVPAPVYVGGAVTVITAALGGYFQISGMTKRADLSECAPTCTTNAVDDARQTLWTGNILLGTALVSLGVTMFLYFTRPAAPDRSTAFIR